MKRLVFLTILSISFLFSSDKTYQELKEENERLNLQLKNSELKQKLESTQKEATTTPPPPKKLS